MIEGANLPLIFAWCSLLSHLDRRLQILSTSSVVTHMLRQGSAQVHCVPLLLNILEIGKEHYALVHVYI